VLYCHVPFDVVALIIARPLESLVFAGTYADPSDVRIAASVSPVGFVDSSEIDVMVTFVPDVISGAPLYTIDVVEENTLSPAPFTALIPYVYDVPRVIPELIAAVVVDTFVTSVALPLPSMVYTL
jgi:hypothetical protein